MLISPPALRDEKMKNKWLISSAVCAALAAGATVAWTQAGSYTQGLPIIGQGSYCVSTDNGNCSVRAPAGPSALTGDELVPADTGTTGGAPPQTIGVPTALMGSFNAHVNRLIGGDFGTNLWQRGTAPATSVTPTTALMTADRWWVYSSGNTATVNRQTGASDTIPTLGFYASMRVIRPTGTDVTPICVGQTLDKQAAAPLIGNNAVFSFYALAGAGFSPAGGNLTVKIAYFTAADSAASQATIQFAGGNSQTFALGTTTGYTNAVAGASQGTTGTVASAIASVPISTTWTRYSVYAPIPTANAAGTAVTGVGVALCMTNVGTGGATDWFEFTGAQLQALPSTASTRLSAGVTSPTGFQRRPAADEALLQLQYSYVIVEGALGPSRSICHFTTANTAMQCPIVFPVQMRIAPVLKYATGFAGFTTTAETTANACTGNTTDATVALAPSTSQVMMQCAIASGTTAAVGLSMTLIDNAGTGIISASAEP